jgi:hypothetical protein
VARRSTDGRHRPIYQGRFKSLLRSPTSTFQTSRGVNNDSRRSVRFAGPDLLVARKCLSNLMQEAATTIVFYKLAKS